MKRKCSPGGQSKKTDAAQGRQDQFLQLRRQAFVYSSDREKTCFQEEKFEIMTGVDEHLLP